MEIGVNTDRDADRAVLGPNAPEPMGLRHAKGL